MFLYFLLGFLLGSGFLAAMYLASRQEHSQQVIKTERVFKEKEILLNFMHALYDGIAQGLSWDAIYQRIVYGSRMATYGVAARFFRYQETTQELKPEAQEGIFPLLKTKVQHSLSRTQFLSLLKQGETFDLGEGCIGQCASTLKPHILSEEELHFLIKNPESKIKIRQMLLCPVFFKEDLFGVVAIANSMQPNGFTREVCALLHGICEQAGIVLNNLRQLERLFNTQKLEFDLQLANHVQAYLLPKPKPLSIPEIDVYAQYLPSQQIGGDLYDIIPIDSHRCIMVIGDVTGHGIPSALIMAKTLTHLKHCSTLEHPSFILKEINATLYGNLPQYMFVTMLCVIIDTKIGTIEFARAGHEYPFVVHDGEVEKIKSAGIALGIVPPDVFDAQIEDTLHRFNKGDACILYTDGLSESKNRMNVEFGGEPLRKTIAAHAQQSAEDMNQAIIQDVKIFKQMPNFNDDLTLITIKRK